MPAIGRSAAWSTPKRRSAAPRQTARFPTPTAFRGDANFSRRSFTRDLKQEFGSMKRSCVISYPDPAGSPVATQQMLFGKKAHYSIGMPSVSSVPSNRFRAFRWA